MPPRGVGPEPQQDLLAIIVVCLVHEAYQDKTNRHHHDHNQHHQQHCMLANWPAEAA